MSRGELKRYSNPTDLPAKRSDNPLHVPVIPLLVFGSITIVALAVVALTVAVVAVSVAVCAIALRPYFKK